MALSDLIAVLEQEAGSEADAILTAARQQASALVSAGAERLSARRAELAAVADSERQGVVARRLVAARREARRLALTARSALIERVMTRVRARLPELESSAAYRDGLPARVNAALTAVGDEPATVTASAAIASAVRAATKGSHATVQVEAKHGPGFRVASADGRVEVDATLAGQLDRQRDELTLAIVRQIEVTP